MTGQGGWGRGGSQCHNHAEKGNFRPKPPINAGLLTGCFINHSYLGTTFVIVKEIIPRVDPIALIGFEILCGFSDCNCNYGEANPECREKNCKSRCSNRTYSLQATYSRLSDLSTLPHQNVGFITGLSVVLVPIFLALVLKKLPDIPSLLEWVLQL